MPCLNRVATKLIVAQQCMVCSTETKDVYIAEYCQTLDNGVREMTLGLMCICSPKCMMEYPIQGNS